MTEEQRNVLELMKLGLTSRAADAIDAALAEIDRQTTRIERLEGLCGKVNEWRRHRIATYGPDEPATLPIVASILAEAAALEGRD